MKQIVGRHISSLFRTLVPGSRKKKLRHPMLSDDMVEVIRQIFDPEWYGVHYPHVIRANHDPFKHFIRHGIQEGLAPNAFFLPSWYLDRYADVSEAGLPSIIHYLKHGAEEGRDPHPDFDAAWYVSQHIEAEPNPLVYHMQVGMRRGFLTRPPFNVADYLPASGGALELPEKLVVDIVLPVYKGLDETRRCLRSVLEDPDRPAGRIIVIDDCSPEPEVSSWLDMQAADGAIHLLRNRVNLGFVRSVNRGMEEAGSHDVVLLNSDTRVPRGWLRRLAAHAWAGERVGTVTPFSNNATICSYPSGGGGPLPDGCDLEQLDQAFSRANAGRSVALPTAVGFCMYIRRDCLDEVGLFDAEAFGRGYGEENEFCMRARTLKWEHRLACDTYVFHEGEVSFGRNSPSRDMARDVLHQRYPDYPRLVSRHVQADPAAPARFAASAMLLRQSGLPVILFVTHGLGGGTERHVQDLLATLKGQAECLILRPNEWGCDLSFPGLPGLANLRFAQRRLDAMVAFLRSCGVQRLHIHHQLGFDDLLHDLVRKIGLPFDLTIHDYYPVCPQINLISSLSGHYCGEPGAASCNACIASSPVHGAKDIVSWRLRLRWMFEEAERILCPSRDVMVRLQRMGIPGNMVVVPHQAVTDRNWPTRVEPLEAGAPLRIAILGTLVAHKGIAAVRNAVQAAIGQPFEFILIGASEPALEAPEGSRYSETGPYQERDLKALIRQKAPHIIWFPAICPETYSYTLTAAIETGLPIIASNLGAFPERLAQHPRSILVSPSESAVTWIYAFRQVREVMLSKAVVPEPLPRPAVEAFYPELYLAPVQEQLAAQRAAPEVPAHLPAVRDLRGKTRPSIVLVPDQIGGGQWSPCGYIRTLLPLERLAEQGKISLTVATPQSALDYQADILVCQRHVAQDPADVVALVEHARTQDMKLFYDIDDNLLGIPSDHPEHDSLMRKAEQIHMVLAQAHAVTVSTPSLQNVMQAYHSQVHVIRNGIDERLLGMPDVSGTPSSRVRSPGAPFRLLYMGTATHDADMEIVLPALKRLHDVFRDKIQIDLIGITTRATLPVGVRRLKVPRPASQTYPAFMSWLARQGVWDAGISPLADTDFNRSKSSIKALDYMAIGALAVLSDVEAYRELPAEAVVRVANDPDAWFSALEKLIANRAACNERAHTGRAALWRDLALSRRLPEWQALLLEGWEAIPGR